MNMEGRSKEAIDRAGVINIHSLLWDQFSAPAYRNIVRYGWRFLDPAVRDEVDSNYALSAARISFDFDLDARCQVPNCTHYAAIQCAHCGKLLCLDHFLDRECFHEDEEERNVLAEGSEDDSDHPHDESMSVNVGDTSFGSDELPPHM